jgi:phage tail-like protein
VTAPAAATAGYPLAAYSFWVSIDGERIGFKEVTGLQLQNSTVTYKDGLSFREGGSVSVIPSRDWVSITMRRGAVAGWTRLVDWQADRSTRKLQVSLIEVALKNGVASSREAIRWVAERAVPVRLEAPTFDASTNEVAIETLEVLATDIRVEHLTNG